MKWPSKHLSWIELKCKDGTPYPYEWRKSRAIELAEVFEIIRAECGGLPIRVLSAYRSEEHNRRIGGAIKSQHLEGRALDLQPPKGMNVKAFYEIIKGLSKITKIRGVGRYLTFVHVDIRLSEKLVTWSGRTKKDS